MANLESRVQAARSRAWARFVESRGYTAEDEELKAELWKQMQSGEADPAALAEWAEEQRREVLSAMTLQERRRAEAIYGGASGEQFRADPVLSAAAAAHVERGRPLDEEIVFASNAADPVGTAAGLRAAGPDVDDVLRRVINRDRGEAAGPREVVLEGSDSDPKTMPMGDLRKLIEATHEARE